jgi:hypothetical protein
MDKKAKKTTQNNKVPKWFGDYYNMAFNKKYDPSKAAPKRTSSNNKTN